MKQKTDYSVLVTRTGADHYQEWLDGFPTKQEAKRFCRNVMNSGSTLDRLLTSCTIYKNTHTSNPWEA